MRIVRQVSNNNSTERPPFCSPLLSPSAAADAMVAVEEVETLMSRIKKLDACDDDCEELKTDVGPCYICLEDDAANVRLDCGHWFHRHCVDEIFKKKWPGYRITFSFLDCPLCRMPISHPAFKESIDSFRELQKKLRALAVEKAKEDGFIKDHKDEEDFAEKAVAAVAFYTCADCKEPYCGGLVSCAREVDIDETKLKCQKCVFNSLEIKDHRCLKHGYKFAMFKCDSCCNIATYDCIYNHYCERCHSSAHVPKDFPCPGLKDCPLGIPHPLNLPAVHGGSDDAIKPFVIGCMRCAGISEEEANRDFGGKYLF